MAAKVNVQGLDVFYHCPGCNGTHRIVLGKWLFNEDVDKPTFHPSVKVSYDNTGQRDCHHFVRDGKIEFLGDCFHELRNKTVEMEDFD